MEIIFGNERSEIQFKIDGDRIYIRSLRFDDIVYLQNKMGMEHSYVHLTGENYRGHFFGGYAKLSETLFYESHEFVETETTRALIIKEKNEKLFVTTVYTIRVGSAAIEAYKTVENISRDELVVESAMPLVLAGIMDSKKETAALISSVIDIEHASPLSFYIESKTENTLPYLWKCFNAWSGECTFERINIENEGFRKFYQRVKCSKYSVTSNGTPSTYRYLPIGILEKESIGYFMFEIFDSGSWSYSFDMPTNGSDVCFYIGKNLYDNGWYKVLRSGESLRTERVRFVGGKDLNTLVREFTLARRSALRKHGFATTDHVVYNNFMQNTFDHPTEELDDVNIRMAKKFGADYFVIDAGWHDDNLDQISPTQKIGEWKENTLSYPSGLNFTLDKIRAAGMKPGLWVEVQSIGVYCKNQSLLPDECFFQIHGKRPTGNRRYQLNFAKAKTREFASNIIESIVQRYAPDYIKIDYNQVEYGTETENGSLTEGLAQHTAAYLRWFEELQDRYPKILFESCASGGMNMTPGIAEKTTEFSLSDLQEFNFYPYILANSPFALLPEQSGIWVMPVRRVIGNRVLPSKELKTTDEEVITNVVNALYRVMHLASKLEHLTPRQEELLKEGIAYYRSLAEVKKTALPIMPNGFTSFGDEVVYVAMKSDKKIYLCVYNLSERAMTIAKDFSEYKITKARLAYPQKAKNACKVWKGVFQCDLKAGTARAFELE